LGEDDTISKNKETIKNPAIPAPINIPIEFPSRRFVKHVSCHPFYRAGDAEVEVPETVNASGKVRVEPPPEAAMSIEAKPTLDVDAAVMRRVLV